MTGWEARVVREEDDKEVIVDFLRKQAIKGHYWFTKGQLSKQIPLPYNRVKDAVTAMATEGFLQIRDADTDNTDFVIALRKDLRDVSWLKRRTDGS